MEELIIFGIFTFFFLIFFIIHLFTKRSIKGKYEFKKRLKRLDKKKVFRYYLYLQGFFLLCKSGNDLSWISVFAFPILLISILTMHFFYLHHSENINKDIDYNSDEFKEFEKQESRDKKINKILKW